MTTVAERIKLFRTVRDIPYYIALSRHEQDYCCATKTPLLQKLLEHEGLDSRRICCRFEWKNFGLPADILSLATSPQAGHEYLEVFIPEKKSWVRVDPCWDRHLSAAGLPIAEWDGMTDTTLGVRPVKTFSPEESAAIIEEIDAVPPAAWQNFFDHNRAFLGAINNWLEQYRSRSRTHAQTH